MNIYQPDITWQEFERDHDGAWRLWDGMCWRHALRNRSVAKRFAQKMGAEIVGRARWSDEMQTLVYEEVESVSSM